MKKARIPAFTGLLALLLLASACGKNTEPKPPTKKAVNHKADTRKSHPNGISELAQLMNDMYAMGQESKAGIIKGEDFDIDIDYRSILTATPTDAFIADFPEFEPLARQYIEAMDRLERAGSQRERIAAHKAMVASCVACHSLSCSGPLVRIRKLHLPKKLTAR